MVYNVCIFMLIDEVFPHMMKRIVLPILALLLLLSGCASAPSQQAQAPQLPENPELLTVDTPEPADSSASPQLPENPEQQAQSPTETESPVQAEYRDSWTAVLSGRKLTARSWFIYDCAGKVFLSTSGDPEEAVFPASVTKLFAAYVALHYIAPDAVLTAGSELALVPIDASIACLKEGDSLTAEQLIGGMMLPSGNDATFVLATAVGRILAEDPALAPEDAIARFVEQMNYHAALVGLTDTHFVTPDGWHNDDHYTSMEDLVKIGMLAWTNPVIAQSATTAEQTIPMDEERSLEWVNTNLLLDPDADVYCPYAVGLKTGFTTPAGNCLLSAFQVGNRQILIGVFGCPDSYDRYAESLLLFTQAFDLQIPELPPETEPTE